MPDAKPRQTLNVDLGELKPLVEAAAKNQGKRPGAWVRRAVELALQEDQAVPAGRVRVAVNRSRGSAVAKLTVRLTAAESDALRELAGAEGLSQAEYVAAVAQGTLVRHRQQVAAELGVLNAVMQAIEQDLKGMASRVNDHDVHELLRRTALIVRAQARRAADVLAETSTTRRKAAQKRSP